MSIPNKAVNVVSLFMFIEISGLVMKVPCQLRNLYPGRGKAFKGTGIESQVDKNGNITYSFSATKKLKTEENETSNTTVNRTT